jgi:GNAT superfamily N-acetyltransferase
MSDDAIARVLADEAVGVTVLSVGGVPAGFFELDGRTAGEIALARIGLIPEFRGRGLARYLVVAAVDAAWSLEPDLVWTETSDRDDPRALLLLQWAGFDPVGTELRRVRIGGGETG